MDLFGPIPMPYIKLMSWKIYKNILKFFSKKKIIQEKRIKNDTEYIASIEFSLTDNEELDIVYKLPDTKTLTLDNITSLSEQYANLLVGINGGNFKADMIAILEKTKKDNEDPQQQLLADNILSFWSILHVINEQNKQQISNKPVISPSSVFRV